jgi:branched-chain amino acid transport system substrate-binding protein
MKESLKSLSPGRRTGLALTSLIAGGCLSCVASAAELKVGVFIPATGRFADLGEQMKDGYEIAFARYAAAQPKLGAEPLTLKVIYYDDEGKADTTVNAVTRALTEDKIDVAVGFLFGEIFDRVMGEFQKASVPVVSCCDGIDETGGIIAREKLTYVFQLSPTARDIVGATLAATVSNLNVTKISLLGENSLAGREHARIAHEWVAEHAKSAEIVSEDLLPPGTTDFTSVLSKIRRLGGQAIVGEELGPSATILFRQWYDMRIPAVIAQHGGTTSSETFIADNKDDVEGAIITNRWWPGRYTDLSEPMMTAFQQQYHVAPTNFSVQAFDSAIVAVDAVKDAGSLDHQKIADALAAGHFVTAWGDRKFTPLEQGHTMPIDLVVVQIQQGKKVPIYPPVLTKSLGTSFMAEPPYAWSKH